MFTVVYIPDFPLQAALRLEPELRDRPVALLPDSTRGARIFQLNRLARESGVHEGLTPTQAMARCQGIVVKTRSAMAEANTQGAVLGVLHGVTPFVEATGEGIWTLDCRRLRQNTPGTGVATTLLAALRSLQLAARIGLAATPELARLAARRAAPVLEVHKAGAFLDDLPVDTLDPSPELLAILGKWGIRTVGALLRLGRGALADRLGPEALALFERVTSNRIRPLRLVQAPERFEESLDLENEIQTLDPLLFILRRLLDQLTVRLALVHLVAERLLLRLRFSAGADHERTFTIPAPTRNPETLFRMLTTYLEGFRSEAPITGVHLRALPSKPLQRQSGLFETGLRDPNRFSETLARLSALVGSDRVGTPVPEPTHRPDAFHLRPPDFDNLQPSAATEPAIGLALRRFRPPIPAQVQVRDGVPVFFSTSEAKGAIERALGPWRSSGDWWDRNRWAREEWDIQRAGGGLYRLFSQQTDWFLEGIYD